MSLIPARSITFIEINYEINSTVILLLPLIQEGLVSVTSESRYVHKVLVNCLVKLAQVGELMTIAVDCDVKTQTKQKKID